MSANAEVPPPSATEPVDLVAADPGWTVRGEQERDHLETLLAPWLIARIAHVGSTSIPNLPAKPIIDLQAPVTDLADSDSIAATLAPHDWHYVDPDLDQRLWRRFFVKVTDGRRSAHLHVMTPDSPRWHEQIAFRDALRANPTLTADYAALKQEHGCVVDRLAGDVEVVGWEVLDGVTNGETTQNLVAGRDVERLAHDVGESGDVHLDAGAHATISKPEDQRLQTHADAETVDVMKVAGHAHTGG